MRIFKVLLLVFLFFSTTTYSCSRFTYTAPKNTVVTGRSMDWMEDTHTELWAFPAGMSKVGGKASNSIKWQSKYGSLIASAYNATVDGINSKGLNVNLLYLASSNYGKQKPEQKNISIYTWAQYVLDNYSTVDEVVKGLDQLQFNMLAPPLPNGMIPPVHMAVTDVQGDNAIFEYIDGHLQVHHGKQYKVMTNEPAYDKQLVLNDYWQRLKGDFLPGTAEPEDRFVRGVYYLRTAPQATSVQKSISVVFSIIRNLSVPISAKKMGKPNVASTIWRSVSDLKNKVYYFESADKPNVFWVDLNELNLKAGTPVKKLPMLHGEVYAGEVSKHFVETKAFAAP